MEEFREWLETQLKQRDWQPADLARKAKLGNSTVTRILNDTRRAGPEVCMAIAGALGEPPEKVFRLAGLLPPETSPAPGEDLLLNTFRRLSTEEQGFLLKLLRAAMGHLSVPEITLTRQIITLPVPNSLSPDMEAIIEVVNQLDELERRLVFDYVRWRLIEQEERRNSSGRRHKSKQAKEEEWKRAIEHIDLLLAVEESNPERHDWVINHLQRIIDDRQLAARKNEDDLPVATQPPGK